MSAGHVLGAITEVQRLADGCAYTLHWPTVLLKLKLVPCL